GQSADGTDVLDEKHGPVGGGVAHGVPPLWSELGGPESYTRAEPRFSRRRRGVRLRAPRARFARGGLACAPRGPMVLRPFEPAVNSGGCDGDGSPGARSTAQPP